MRKYYYEVPLLNFEEDPGVPLLNFEGCPGSRSEGPEVPGAGVMIPLLHYAGKYLRSSLFLIKLQAFRSATLLKRDSGTGAFCEYCEIFKNAYFEENL